MGAANFNHICLTIPKKVVAANGGVFTVETPDGSRQEVKSILPLDIGDYVLTLQNMAIEKIEKEEAEQLLKEIIDIREGGAI